VTFCLVRWRRTVTFPRRSFLNLSSVGCQKRHTGKSSSTKALSRVDGQRFVVGHVAECLVTVGVPSVDPIVPTSVILNWSSLLMYPGSTLPLIATVSPDDAVDKRVIWSSSAVSDASVVDGLVTAHKVGVAVITVTVSRWSRC
jgi:uncharacterized protein YjdB